MPPIEIHQNKKTLIPMLVIFLAAVIGAGYYAFFTGKWDKEPVMKLIYVSFSAALLIGIYFSVRKFIKNEPVIIISKSEITINERIKPVTYLWIQVVAWRIEEDSDSSRELVIETAEEKKKININWLEKDHKEIEELIITYSGKAPHK